MNTEKTLQDRIALVTGASRGIGAAVAKAYAKAGAQVILVGRDVAALEAVDDAIRAEGGSATLVPLDLKQPEKLDQLALHLAERYGKLDILVGNAGFLKDLRPMTHITDKIWNETLLVNLTANHRLLRAFHPLLRKSDAGRAIFTSSDTAQVPYAYWGIYGVSKAALEQMVKIYAAEVAQTPIRANLVDPGKVITRLRSAASPNQKPEDGYAPEDVVAPYLELASPACLKHGEVVRVDA